MIWWKYLLVLVYSIVLSLKTKGLIVIAKIVFLNKQANICWFKYELRGFYEFTLRNIAIGQYHGYRKQMFGASTPFQIFLFSVISQVSKVKLATIVEGDPKAPFSIATTPRCRGGRYSIPRIAPLYPWTVPYNAES